MKSSIVLISVLLIFSTASCAKQSSSGSAENTDKFKMLFIYGGVKESDSWDRPHHAAANSLRQRLGSNIEVFEEDKVPEDKDTVQMLLDKYAAQGVNMVIGISFGHGEILRELAPSYSDIFFEQCGGFPTGDNFSVYFGRFYQARYLTGLTAGLMTRAGRIGYIGSFEFPETVRGINAFTLGVKAVNPRAQVLVYWGLTWGDPEINRQITGELFDELGVDIVAHQQSALTIGEEAAKRGKYVIGNNFDMSEAHGDTVLISPVWDWGAYYADRVKKAIIGAWHSDYIWGSMLKNNGMVKVSGFSPVVPEAVRQRVNQSYKQITSGLWDVFHGPIKDRQGRLIVPDGAGLSDQELLSMDYYVDGVIEAGVYQ